MNSKSISKLPTNGFKEGTIGKTTSKSQLLLAISKEKQEITPLNIKMKQKKVDLERKKKKDMWTRKTAK